MRRSSRSRLRNAIETQPASPRKSTCVPRKTEPPNSARAVDIRRPSLQLHQPVRRFGENRKFWQIAAHHCHLVAAMKSRTSMAVFIDLVGKVFALRDRESLAPKEIRFAGE